MPFDMETFSVIHKPCCASRHSACKRADDNYWKSPVKIMMLNVSIVLGINNLWSHKSSLSRRHGTPLWILAVLFVILVLALSVDAYPTMSRAVSDHHSRKFFPSSIGNSGSSPSRPYSEDTNTSSDVTLSLSIFSPLDILRQNMILEIQRKKRRQAKQRQVQSNQAFLDRIG